MSDAALSMVILAGTVVLFVWNRFPVELVAIASALALYFTGVIDLTEMLSGFGDPAVVMIAALFIVSEGLDVSGVTAWAGQELSRRARGSTTRVLLLTMALVAVLTALIGLNASVASLLPMAVILAMRLGIPTSRLLMPMAFAGSAGALLMLTGSPSTWSSPRRPRVPGSARSGCSSSPSSALPLLLGSMALIFLVGPRVLPDRSSASLPPDLSSPCPHAGGALLAGPGLPPASCARGSPLIGTPRSAACIGSGPGCGSSPCSTP